MYKYEPVRLHYESKGFAVYCNVLVILGIWPKINFKTLSLLGIPKQKHTIIARKSLQVCLDKSRIIYATHVLNKFTN